MTIVLGLETSCDETAAALVQALPDGSGRILSNQVFSQIADHAPYGGVVPEIAARAHIARLDGLIAAAMAEAGIGFSRLSAIAATAGPGLIGGLLVGLTMAKAIALARTLPLVGVNHLEAHALTVRLLEPVAFPYLLLLVSGGHTQILCVDGVGRYRRLGTTMDDALGEAFDKTAKLLGLGHPGGPHLEVAARQGDATRFAFPRPLKGREGCDFSFSGLKTAVRDCVAGLAPEGQGLDIQTIRDASAGFEAAVCESVAERVDHALAWFAHACPAASRVLVVAGGVAANQALASALRRTANQCDFRLVVPPLHLCTDNAAMVAWAGLERLACGFTDALDIPARPRWPLDPDAAPGTFPKQSPKQAEHGHGLLAFQGRP